MYRVLCCSLTVCLELLALCVMQHRLSPPAAGVIVGLPSIMPLQMLQMPSLSMLPLPQHCLTGSTAATCSASVVGHLLSLASGNDTDRSSLAG